MVTSSPEVILDVSDLSIYYGNMQAVRQVTFNIVQGEIFGLLGPNGAGKTSTLSAIEGLIPFAEGAITVDGYNIKESALQARAAMGIQLQSTSFQPELKMVEILRLFASLYGVRLRTKQIYSMLENLGLADAAGKRFAQLSGGQQQRISLAIATLHQPKLVLLDEPTSGLDPQSRRNLWESIEKVRENGNGVLLTTHSMEEAQSVCDRIAIIDHGQIIATGTPQALLEQYQDDSKVVEVSRKGTITLEDVFIGLTGRAVRL